MRNFSGIRSDDKVHVTTGSMGMGVIMQLAVRPDILNLSPTFDWGVLNDGCRQLAISILAQVGGDFIAKEKYEAFAAEVLAKEHHMTFGMDELIVSMWIQTGRWIIDQRAYVPGDRFGVDVHEMRPGDLETILRVNMMYLQKTLQDCIVCLDASLKKGLRLEQ